MRHLSNSRPGRKKYKQWNPKTNKNRRLHSNNHTGTGEFSKMDKSTWTLTESNIPLFSVKISDAHIIFERMTLMQPFRSPPSTAILMERSDKINMPDVCGKWDWMHDGINKNGDMILHKSGSLSHVCGWSGGHWKYQADGKFFIDFNNVKHVMALTEDR